MPIRMTADHYRGDPAYEPQRANQGIVRFFGAPFAGVDWKVLELTVRQFGLPKFQDNRTEVRYLNETVKFAGSREYDDLTMVFNSTISGQNARLLNAWKSTVHDPVTGRKGLATQYKRQGEMFLLQPDGTIDTNRRFQLIGAWPQSLDSGEVDYEADTPILINTVFCIDKVIPPDAQSFNVFNNLLNLADSAQRTFRG